LGIGDWGLGIGDWGLGVGALPQPPPPQTPNPQSPIPNPHSLKLNILIISKYITNKIKEQKLYINNI